jgi:iron complex transport system substrate-binding protein
VKRAWLLAVAPALALALFASPCAAQTVLRDDRGVELNLVAPPRRIVSLLPSLTETVCALDACSRLVGTDEFSNWPERVKSLPKLGGLEDAQVERIVALRPDMVLAAKSARVVDRLESLGLKVVVLESDTHADVRRALETVARLLGKPAAGERLWAGIERDLSAAAARVPAALRGKAVYFEVGSGPYAAGASSFIGQTLTRLGMGNIVPATMPPFPLLNPEFVVRMQPDVVMASARDVAEMRSRPGWQGLGALSGRSCGFDDPRFELLVRPGPRLGEAAGVLADCLAGIGSR